MTTSRETAAANAAVTSATRAWRAHVGQCSSCRLSGPPVTCDSGGELFRAKRDAVNALAAARAADAGELPGQGALF